MPKPTKFKVYNRLAKMAHPIITASQGDPFDGRDDGTNGAWAVALAAAREAAQLCDSHESASFAIDQEFTSAQGPQPAGELRRVLPTDPDVALVWHPEGGWELMLSPDDRRSALIDLY